MSEIRISTQSAFVIFLAVLVLVISAYCYRSYDLYDKQDKINRTQQLLLQLYVDNNTARLFTELGYNVRILPQQQPQTQQNNQ